MQDDDCCEHGMDSDCCACEMAQLQRQAQAERHLLFGYHTRLSLHKHTK
jgi:hypothetical protein